jgi:4-amino-4-deoxy-L-arabinose transferase-like glycosyltransferase
LSEGGVILKRSLEGRQGLVIVGIIWILGILVDRFWFYLDYTIPAWDQADYLNGGVMYTQALQTPRWFDGSWWRSLWLMSPKIPPLTYILTIPFFNLFGISADSGVWVMAIYSAILLFSVYGLGIILFNTTVALWAVLICQFLPGLYYYRLEYLLDFPLAAIVTFSYFCLTWWRFREQGWLKAIALGISFGLAMLVKQTALFFSFLPILWVLGENIGLRRWGNLAQLMLSFFTAALLMFPWYRTNWLLMLTAGKRATVDSAILEGDPSLTSLDAWTFYPQVLPYFLSWVLLLIPVVGLLMSLRYRKIEDKVNRPVWIWLGVFLVGGYLLSSLNINKDARYILPLLPTLSIILSVGLLSWRGRFAGAIRWGTITVAAILMSLNLFPLGGEIITNALSPKLQHHPYLNTGWQHEEVVKEILKTSPYLRTTLGVLPSTPELNQHTFSFYGGKYNSQVAGRQVGVREKDIEQDAKSLDWFLTKTGEQGSVPDVQKKIVNRVTKGKDFQVQKTWQLPDDSNLSLYHKIEPLVTVKPIDNIPQQIGLKAVTVPEKAPPNQPIPVTYTWQGNWEQLKSGIVILTWQEVDGKDYWLHDHGLGMGGLVSGKLMNEDQQNGFEVIEKTAMQSASTPGIYKLSAIYLNRETGESYPIPTNAQITIDPNASSLPAPELDLVTQLRLKSANIGQGLKGVEPIFELSNRINQYDAIQDYVVQADKAFSYRLQQQNPPDKLSLAYGLAISKVLQQDVEGAIKATDEMIKIDPHNPYHYAYQGFVYLYDWKPQQAQKVLEKTRKLNPNSEEIKTLNAVAALMGGNLIKAWSLLR